MDYYKRVMIDPKTGKAGRVLSVCRMDIGDKNVITERWDFKSGSWKHDPNVLGDVTGIDGMDYDPISESEGLDLTEKKK